MDTIQSDVFSVVEVTCYCRGCGTECCCLGGFGLELPLHLSAASFCRAACGPAAGQGFGCGVSMWRRLSPKSSTILRPDCGSCRAAVPANITVWVLCFVRLGFLQNTSLRAAAAVICRCSNSMRRRLALQQQQEALHIRSLLPPGMVYAVQSLGFEGFYKFPFIAGPKR